MAGGGYMIQTIGELGELGECACSRGMGDTSEAMQLITGGWLPTVVWPSDVEAYKRKLDPDFRATDAAAKACTTLDAGELSAWTDFNKAWRDFADAPTSTFGSANQYDAAKEFEIRLQAWQALIAKSCKLNSPGVVPPSGPDTSVIKWAAAAAIAIALAYVASPLILGARKVTR